MADVYPDPLPRATNMTNSSLSSLAQTRRAALLDTNIILDDATAIVPFEQKNAIAKRIPLLLIVQRFLNRLRPGISLDTVLALIAIYMAGKPVYESLEKFFYSKLTSQVKISERQQIGRDVLAYMTDTVLCTDSSYKATVVSNGAYDENDILNSMMLTRYRRTTNREPQGRSVQYLPWMGQTRLFW